MCGIVGYSGPREAAPILLEGLARLEYRGYDSAGIALVRRDGSIFIEKRAGKLENLRAAIGDAAPSSGAGLAHTRWATHGRPNDLNAHPHADCTGDIVVIHNGIIENFRELRDGLAARGHQLASETDTEALAHLVEEEYAGDIGEAVRRALARASGAYALAVLHRGEPGRLIGARMNVPLIVGIGDGETFLASDVAAVVAYTNRVMFLEEGDVADLNAGSLRITGLDGEPRERAVHAIDWTIEAAEKGGFAHFMLKEMHEQPDAIRAAVTGRLVRDHLVVDELDPVRRALAEADRVEFVACGTAAYASLVGAHLVESLAGVPARVTVASEFRYAPPPLDRRTLVVAVSQSGETADTLAATRLARSCGCPIVAVTNTVGSALTRDADAVCFLQAGPEIAVAATKTFVTQVAVAVMVAAVMARARGRLDSEYERELVAGLRALPDQARRALALDSLTRDAARRYVGSRGFMFIGRGVGYPAALEGALKLKEISYTHAEGYAAGELKHGPISLLDVEVPLVAVATRSSVREKLLSNVMEGRARDARVIAVATEGDDEIARYADDVFAVPDTLEALSPILAVIPLQLFAYHMAVARGNDVDQPRNLAKSVTVE
ncbi:MAG: glutamine--fructose-6-phosphate transaminase (isomerizing) [Candidatus Limnocylindrales bacterium]